VGFQVSNGRHGPRLETGEANQESVRVGE